MACREHPEGDIAEIAPRATSIQRAMPSRAHRPMLTPRCARRTRQPRSQAEATQRVETTLATLASKDELEAMGKKFNDEMRDCARRLDALETTSRLVNQLANDAPKTKAELIGRITDVESQLMTEVNKTSQARSLLLSSSSCSPYAAVLWSFAHAPTPTHARHRSRLLTMRARVACRLIVRPRGSCSRTGSNCSRSRW